MRKKIAVAFTIALFSALSLFTWSSSQATETRQADQMTFSKVEKGDVTGGIFDRGGRTFRARRLKKPLTCRNTRSLKS